jgi:hypothetical protein
MHCAVPAQAAGWTDLNRVKAVEDVPIAHSFKTAIDLILIPLLLRGD